MAAALTDGPASHSAAPLHPRRPAGEPLAHSLARSHTHTHSSRSLAHTRCYPAHAPRLAQSSPRGSARPSRSRSVRGRAPLRLREPPRTPACPRSTPRAHPGHTPGTHSPPAPRGAQAAAGVTARGSDRRNAAGRSHRTHDPLPSHTQHRGHRAAHPTRPRPQRAPLGTAGCSILPLFTSLYSTAMLNNVQ